MSFNCIGIIGDSIAQGFYSNNNEGWFGKFISKLTKDNPCLYSSQNMAVAGERSIDAYHRLHSEAFTKQIDILFISVGLNDLIRWHSKESQTDISEGYREEIWHKLLESSKKNINKIIVTSILPVIESRQPAFGDLNRKFFVNNLDIEEYNSFLKKISSKYNIDFINLSKAWENQDLKKVIIDSSHPNELGHKLIAEYLYKTIEL